MFRAWMRVSRTRSRPTPTEPGLVPKIWCTDLIQILRLRDWLTCMRVVVTILGYGFFAAITFSAALVAYSDWQQYTGGAVFAQSR
jgi:hypothetical protein